MVVHCDTCDCDVPSAEQMQHHVAGKKHQKNVTFLGQRLKEAELSIHVNKLPKGTNGAELAEYFSKFGEVRRVNQPGDGSYAFVEFVSPDIVAKIVDDRHYIRKKLICVKKMLTRIASKKKKAVQFAKREHDKPLLSTIDDMEVKARAQKLKLAAVGGGIAEQMETLVKSTEVSHNERQERQNICDSLQAILEPFFPGCFVNPFGSSVNGFGVSGCDMDIFLDLTDVGAKRAVSVPCPPLPYTGDIPSLAKKRGPFSTKDLEALSALEKIKLLSRIISEYVHGCSNIFTIPSIRCPVVRFVHEISGIKCDVSINNKLALQNSRLLYLYSQIDPRVRPFIYTIRNWAKFREIAGNENSGPRLSNYCLVLMALHYLQNTKPPVVPTLPGLRDQSTLGVAVAEMVIEGWDCSFISNPQRIQTSENKSSHDELLLGFLQFYANFDFDTNVISIAAGHTLPITDFLPIPKTTDVEEKIRKFKLGPVNVQDPFVLNHNIAFNVNEKTRLKIVDEFKIAVVKFSDWILSGTTDNSLVDLWSAEIPTAMIGNILNSFVTKMPEGRYAVLLTLKPYLMPRDVLLRLQNLSFFRLEWCRKVCIFVHNIFKDVLKFQCHILTSSVPELSVNSDIAMADSCHKKRSLDKEENPVAKRTRDTSSFESGQGTSRVKNLFCIFKPNETADSKVPAEAFEVDSSKVNVEMMVQACYETWSNRKQVRQELLYSGIAEGLELEKATSAKICPGLSQKLLCEFRCTMSIFTEASRTAVILNLEPIYGLPSFQFMYVFMKPYLTKLVEKYLTME